MDSKTSRSGTPLPSGKLPYVHDARTFHLSSYLAQEPSLKIPLSFNWSQAIAPDQWSAFGNLKINNCTCATAGHLMMAWTASIGRLRKPTTKSIVAAYTALTGYNAKTDGIGQPIEALKALKYWRKHGIGGRKIISFAKLAYKNAEELKEAIYLYGGSYIGLNLPKSAEAQYNRSAKWTVPRGGPSGDGEPGTWLGHALMVTGYTKNELTAVSWGRVITMSLDFWEAYVDESYAVFSADFVKDNHTPTKINVEVLKKDIEELQRKKSGIE